MKNKSKTMLLRFRFILLVLLVVMLLAPAGLGSRAKQQKRRKLFVFGDSYADTGNWKTGTGVCWEAPYGSTFPGKPTGRFSDGRILTDFIASYLGIRSPPVPYTQRGSPSAAKKLKFGMNFAYGGTGVFDTRVSQPNMTTQIDFFRNVLESEAAYTIHDLEASIALIALGVNDYAKLLRSSAPSQPDVKRFTKSVVDEMASNLKRIHKLGVPKVAVTGLEPLGCLPAVTSSTLYRNCTDRFNDVATLHNRLLEQSVTKLNNQTTDSSPVFFVLDLYGAFMSGLKTSQFQTGKVESESALKPCCQGVRGEFGCGSRDGNQTKYKVCREPEKAFFWDSVHPAQQGWHLIFSSLKPSLNLIK